MQRVKEMMDQLVLTPRRRGSYPRGKCARPSRGQRGAVEHWRLVSDVVGPRTRDIVLKGKSMWRHRDRFRSTGLSTGFTPINTKPHSDPPPPHRHFTGDSPAAPSPNLPGHRLSYQVLGLECQPRPGTPQSPCSSYSLLRKNAAVFTPLEKRA